MLWSFILSFSLIFLQNLSGRTGISLNNYSGVDLQSRSVMSERMQVGISNDVSCAQSPIQTNVTLKGGIEAGYFRKLAQHVAMQLCIELCCEEKGCDVAFMSGKNCYGVQCFNGELCKTLPAKKQVAEPVMISHVTFKGERASSLHLMETTDNQLVCKNSQVFYNTTLKGGYRAGNYTNFGKVGNMSACIRLCCGNKDCDAALMLENNCFAVACEDSDKCLPVHAKASTSLAALNPRISYITSRSEEVSLGAEFANNGSCHAGIVSYDVSLKGGSNAGNFTPHGRVGSMEICIYKCCQIEGCSVAMMLKDTCFTVVCRSEELCEKRQTPTSSDFNPRIAYVFREKSRRPRNKHVTNKYSTKESLSPSMESQLLLAERLHAIANVPWPTSFASTDKHVYQTFQAQLNSGKKIHNSINTERSSNTGRSNNTRGSNNTGGSKKPCMQRL